MRKPQTITGTFERRNLGSLHGKMPVPTGWFVLPFRLMPKIDERRKYHGKWFTIESEQQRIFRVLRFAPNLHGSIKDNNPKDILLDWVGWIDLCGRDEEVEVPLQLKISKSTLWQKMVCAGLKHPEPTYRFAYGLALVSVGLGLLSILLAILLSL